MTDKLEALSQPIAYTDREELESMQGPDADTYANLWAIPHGCGQDIALYSQEYVTALRAESAKWFKAFEKAVSVGASYEERIAELSVGNVGNALLERENHHVEVVANLTRRLAELEGRLQQPIKLPVGFSHQDRSPHALLGTGDVMISHIKWADAQGIAFAPMPAGKAGIGVNVDADVAGKSSDGNHVKVGMWFSAADKLQQARSISEIVGPGVSVVFGFPECTDLTVAGARHFEAKSAENPLFQIEAAELADLVRIVGLVTGAAWAFENPVGVLSSMYRKPDFTFHPCDFAGYLPADDAHPLYPDVYPGRDRYNKTTCIWCGGGFVKPKPRREEPESKDNPGWKLCGGKSTRTKNIRSATPRGFAQAVFEANGQHTQGDGE
ncbi:hypothetical protein [Serratia fonticola]